MFCLSSQRGQQTTQYRQQFINECLSSLNDKAASRSRLSHGSVGPREHKTIRCDHVVPGAYLTCQEHRCVQYLLEGYKYKLIAHKMGLSVRTVEFYVNNIKKKFNCKKKAELIALFKNAQKAV